MNFNWPRSELNPERPPWWAIAWGVMWLPLYLVGIVLTSIALVMVGEIGGTDEEECAAWVKENMTKPVVGFIAGVTAPPGKRMGHAGAIISGGKGTAQEKIAAMEDAGITVTKNPSDIGKLMKEALRI